MMGCYLGAACNCWFPAFSCGTLIAQMWVTGACIVLSLKIPLIFADADGWGSIWYQRVITRWPGGITHLLPTYCVISCPDLTEKMRVFHSQPSEVTCANWAVVRCHQCGMVQCWYTSHSRPLISQGVTGFTYRTSDTQGLPQKFVNWSVKKLWYLWIYLCHVEEFLWTCNPNF